MQIKKELAKVKPQKEMLLSIGVFDGVHLGHQRLLTHLRDEARQRNCLSGVVTFSSHPEVVLFTENQLLWLNDLETRVSLLRDLGIDVVVILPFSPELAQLSAREFVQLLKDHLKMRGLIIGPDFALGRGREGDAEKLRLLGKEMCFSVEVIPAMVLHGQVVSSSAIRQALAQGDVEKVGKLIGRLFSLSGRIVSGNGRGRTLGFPTANLELNAEQALPGDGVYATIAHVDHHIMPSVTNVGVRPTFENSKHLVETYIFDYEGNLLGQKFTIDLVDKIRDEKRFDTEEELKTQIGRDVEQAGRILRERMK
ncbi:MAG: riboflavin biosynthesis protein RibF [Chloroflexi bacterium RBG_19FT_COMBO_48_23]|nr:MAG: riboflavin biosynthesis protein RibF [Chloroflexi bacterium RBG_19FT_COMBO_48_23]